VLYTAAPGGTLPDAGAAIGTAGAVVLAATLLLRVAAFAPWAMLLVGAGYVLGREHQQVVDGWAALVGAALLLAAELAAWSIDDDRRIHEERAVVLRRAAVVGALTAAAALVAFVLVGAAAVSVSTGLLLTAVGVTAAVSTVALVLRLLRV